MRRLRETQAAAPKYREMPRGRPGGAGLRLSPKRLEDNLSANKAESATLRYAVPKLNQWGRFAEIFCEACGGQCGRSLSILPLVKMVER